MDSYWTVRSKADLRSTSKVDYYLEKKNTWRLRYKVHLIKTISPPESLRPLSFAPRGKATVRQVLQGRPVLIFTAAAPPTEGPAFPVPASAVNKHIFKNDIFEREFFEKEIYRSLTGHLFSHDHW